MDDQYVKMSEAQLKKQYFEKKAKSPPKSEKRTGKKEGGWREGIFARSSKSRNRANFNAFSKIFAIMQEVKMSDGNNIYQSCQVQSSGKKDKN